MKPLKFICTLESDVIINQRAATEGNQETLDFIPGSAFLGIAAGELYQNTDDENFEIFHSGKVRFGDAHPLHNSVRGLRSPASFYHKKGEKLHEGAFIYHNMPNEGIKDKGKPVQVKQVRAGYMIKDEQANSIHTYKVDKSFAIKSAYDREKRRAKDSMMYGYEAISQGIVMGFEITFSPEVSVDIIEKVKKAIIGHKKIGRSSSAQFGLVNIEEKSFENRFKSFDFNYGLMIYAESRLLFLDDFGMFTQTPEPKHFGIEKKDAEIDWEKTQVRTFRYAPFNSKRMQSDADRLCIEKGSVFFINGITASELDEEWSNKPVGSMTNEGFGKILVNPEFLQSQPGDPHGKALFSFVKEKDDGKDKKDNKENPSKANLLALKGEIKDQNPYDQPVFEYLIKQAIKDHKDKEVYAMVNKFVNDPSISGLFKQEKFASQWGTIRMKAMVAKDRQKLFDDLFTEPKGYLVHGVAKEKWEGRRINVLKNFCSKFLKPEYDFNFMQQAIVNLAAEMAKKSRKENS